MSGIVKRDQALNEKHLLFSASIYLHRILGRHLRTPIFAMNTVYLSLYKLAI
jgi:hypothetical protein